MATFSLSSSGLTRNPSASPSTSPSYASQPSGWSVRNPSYTPAPLKPKYEPITSSTKFIPASGGTGGSTIRGTVAPGAGIPKDSIISQVKELQGAPIKREPTIQKFDPKLLSSRPGTTGRLPDKLAPFVQGGKLDVKGALTAQREIEAREGLKTIGGIKRDQDFDLKVQGIGAEKITQKTARDSLKAQGIDLSKQGGSVQQQILIENERNRLQSIAATPQQRGRLAAYGLALSAVPATAFVAGGGIGATATQLTTLSPKIKAGLAFGESLFMPDAFATISGFLNPETKSSKKLTKKQKEEMRSIAFKEAELGLEYEKTVEKVTQKAEPGFIFKETGTDVFTQNVTKYTPKEGVPGFDVPFLGRLTAFDIVPGKGLLIPEFTSTFEKSIKEQAIAQGLSEKEAREYAKREAFVQSTSRAGGELFGTFQVGVGEEILASNLLKKSVEQTGKLTAKGLSVTAAKELVKKEAVKPLLIAGGIGGASSVIVEQRSKAQQLDPFSIALGGATGGIFAVGLGVPIVSTAIDKPLTSKAIYGIGSIFDPFEPIADIFVGKAKKAAGQTDLMIPIVTPTPSVSPTPSVAITPTQVIAPTPTTTITPTPSPTITPSFSIVSTPQPTPLITPTQTLTPTTTQTPQPTPTTTEELTETLTETPTQTLTPTPTQTLTPTPTPTTTFKAPFVPLGGPGLGAASGVGKYRKKARTRYFDELASAKSLLKDFGPKPYVPFKQKSKPKIHKKKTKKTGVVYPRVNTPQINFETVFSIGKKTKKKRGNYYDFGI